MRIEWLKQPIMGQKGMAGGVAGATHCLTIEDQKTFQYVYRPYADPVLEVDPCAVVTVETHDAFEGKVKTEVDKPSEVLQFPFLNLQSGPIQVRGAEKGDVLAVRIISVKPRGPQPVGPTCLIPEFGGLVSTGQTAVLNAPLPEIVKNVVVDEAGVHWSDTLTQSWSRDFGPVAKVDLFVKEMIPNEEEKEPLSRLQGQVCA